MRRFVDLSALLSIALVCTLLCISCGDKPKAIDISWQTDEITRLVVDYDLSGEPDTSCSIGLCLSLDNGKTCPIEPRAVQGDVGDGVTPGPGKRIIWDVFKDELNLNSDEMVLEISVYRPGSDKRISRATSEPQALHIELMPKALIQAGGFNMGSPADEPHREADEGLHRVEITRPFLMGATEVTQQQWNMVMGSGPSYFTSCGFDCPVEQVSWFDAVRFCNKLSEMEGLTSCYTLEQKQVAWDRDCNGYYLPTEAQWEYAARAGSETAFPNGAITQAVCGPEPGLEQIGWYCRNSRVHYQGCYDATGYDGPECAGVHPVGQKQPNAWGLYDMNGNVMEWVWDCYAKDYGAGPADDPTGPDCGDHRVVRGGSWIGYARTCRSADRQDFMPDFRSSDLGFRVARSLN